MDFLVIEKCIAQQIACPINNHFRALAWHRKAKETNAPVIVSGQT